MAKIGVTNIVYAGVVIGGIAFLVLYVIPRLIPELRSLGIGR